MLSRKSSGRGKTSTITCRLNRGNLPTTHFLAALDAVLGGREGRAIGLGPAKRRAGRAIGLGDRAGRSGCGEPAGRDPGRAWLDRRCCFDPRPSLDFLARLPARPPVRQLGPSCGRPPKAGSYKVEHDHALGHQLEVGAPRPEREAGVLLGDVVDGLSNRLTGTRPRIASARVRVSPHHPARCLCVSRRTALLRCRISLRISRVRWIGFSGGRCVSSHVAPRLVAPSKSMTLSTCASAHGSDGAAEYLSTRRRPPNEAGPTNAACARVYARMERTRRRDRHAGRGRAGGAPFAGCPRPFARAVAGSAIVLPWLRPRRPNCALGGIE